MGILHVGAQVLTAETQRTQGMHVNEITREIIGAGIKSIERLGPVCWNPLTRNVSVENSSYVTFHMSDNDLCPLSTEDGNLTVHTGWTCW